MAEITVAALPGLLGFLSDDQRAVLTAAAGLDGGAVRSLAEMEKLVGQPPDVLWFYLAETARTLLRGVVTPAPTALRLLCSLLCESGLAEAVHTSGQYSVLGIVPALRAGAFPARARFAVVNLWTGGLSGHTYPAGVRVVSPAGEVLLTSELPLQALGVGATYAQEFQLEIAFPTPGNYSVEVWLIGGPLYAQYLPVYQYVTEAADGQR